MKTITDNEVVSGHVAFVEGDSSQLDIIFSHNAPAGRFSPGPEAIISANSKLFIKEDGHRFYQQGIPGISEDVENTARWIENFIHRVRPVSVRMIGFSTGGFGALMFGHLLSADAIYAFGTEINLGHPKYRSHIWSEQKYHPVYAEMDRYLNGLGKRLYLAYSAYEPMEYKSIGECLDGSARNLLFTPSLHPGGNCVHLNLWQAETALLPPEEVVSPQYGFRYGRDEVEQIRRAHELTIDADYRASRDIFVSIHARDPRNFGISAHIGVQDILLGRMADGLSALESAIANVIALDGVSTAHQMKSIIRGYYWHDPGNVRLLEESFAQAWAASSRAGG